MSAVHGHTANNGRWRSPTYNSWRAMIERCSRPAHPFYASYGGRGITVHGPWRGAGGFTRFLADMGERPDGMTLDRRDVDGDYEPGNCQWASKWQQRWNRRDMAARLLELDGLELAAVADDVIAVESAAPWPF